MFDIFQTIIASVTSLFVLVASPITTVFTPTPTPTPVNTITATGTYSYQGYSINISIEFPKTGGSVVGKIEGDCNGGVKGAYVTDTQIIEGGAEGVCSVLIFKVNAQADIDGRVLLDQERVEVDFVGKAEGFAHTGKLTLTFK